MAITTAAALRTNYLNIPDSSQDAILTALIGQAQKMMESITMQPLESTSIVEYFDGNGSIYWTLPYTSPVTITSLQSRTLPTDSWTTVSGAVVFTSDKVQRLYYGDGLTTKFWRANLSVGWTSGSMPADLVNICSEIALELFAATDFGGGQNRFGLASLAESQGGITSTTVYKDLMSRYHAKLRPYTLRLW